MNQSKLQHNLLELSEEASELYLPKTVQKLTTAPTPLEFLRQYVMPNIPVVVENGVSHWLALQKWDEKYLNTVLGEKEVTVSFTPNGYADAPVDEFFVLPHEEKMKFKEFIEIHKKNKQNDIAYIQNQNSSFFEEFSELLPDAATDIPWATEAFGRQPDAVNFWMGNQYSITSFHKDHYENLYAVITGSKTFILLPPTDLPCLTYKHYKVGRYFKNRNNQYKIIPQENKDRKCKCENKMLLNENCNDRNVILSKDKQGLTQMNNHNLVDNVVGNKTQENYFNKSNEVKSIKTDASKVTSSSSNSQNNSEFEIENRSTCFCTCDEVPWIANNPLQNNDEYPLYKYTHQLEINLLPGDLLYLPSLWFHHVQQTQNTIAVNFWYDMEYDIKYNYYKFMENIIGINNNS